ncbi:TPA: 50S ribosomal protein L30 [Candidatus Sumerlaeota bacterium]|jgi:large subunit ribosomal protein L30|nr:50S ribosomal protein L30 [Candidatus Sumerlaeota bacterium]
MTTDSKKIRVKYVKSAVSAKPAHARTIKALGLGKLQSEVVHTVNPQILGMVQSVCHLVTVQEEA